MNNEKNKSTETYEKITFTEKLKKFNNERIRNKEFFRRGGYSVTITAIALAIIVLFNFLVGKLSKKVNLEFDMTGNNANSLTAENEKYIKSIKDPVEIIVCSKESEYTSYLLNYSQQLFNVIGDERFFNQTVKFLNKYALLNDNISVKFVDVQSAEYTAINQKYASYKLAYGDIIVTCTKNNNTRDKHLSFKNIYDCYDATGYASYGYGNYQISGNNLESALSSAISYVESVETHKIALYKGHSANDYTSAYKTLLEANNYTVDVVSAPYVTDAINEYDAIAIVAPSIDFIDAEIDVLSNFLDNDGKGGKGIIYFGTAENPSLPKLNEFLFDWGIEVGDGLLFETKEGNLPNKSQRSALFSVPKNATDITEGMNGFITAYNVPLTVVDGVSEDITLMSIAATSSSVTVAPIGADDEWKDYTESDLASFDTVIESKMKIGDDNSYVFAFSSIEFISSEWAENTSISNKNLVLSVTDVACRNVANGMNFVPKSSASESFSSVINESETSKVRTIFVIILPIIVLASGIVVFIRRRNSK